MSKRSIGLKTIGLSITMGAIAVGWVGMIYGWGLTAVSWPWIIGTTIGSLLLIGVGNFVGSDD